MTRLNTLRCLTALLLVSSGSLALAQIADVTLPGDPIIASSSNSPGSEGVANAIDGTQNKYLNFDTRIGGSPSGFVVSPSVGSTVVTGLSLMSANDAIERDPKVVTLEGSNDDTVTDFASGNWEEIVRLDNIPAWDAVFGADNRFKTQFFYFQNFKPFKHYRFTVHETQTPNGCCFQIGEVELLGTSAPKDVTQPGDPIIASSSNSPGSEGVANAIDGTQNKYLNFDTRIGGSPSGFVVSPSVGSTVVTGLSLMSANDAIERDPKVVTIEGSNDDTVTDFASGNWEEIVRLDNIPAWDAVFGADNRFKTQQFFFANFKPYKHYRFTVHETQTPNGCCFQIGEVELLGTSAPKDVTQPGDPIIASSSNSPGSEGVANAIDGTQNKYLNFDTRIGGKPSGFVVTPSAKGTVVTGLSLMSANDAIERDPKVVTLEGSNDDVVTDFASGNWEEIVRLDNIPGWDTVFGADNRFKTQFFYFENFKPYKHYRFTVHETQTPNGCCFQIGEVELLAVIASNPCDGTPRPAFVMQPINTPVLEGQPATFFVQVNGPWLLQWYKNDQPIPGATGLSYTTGPVTPENASDVYSVEIVGCERSTEVRAEIFTPSATKSIGISFVGGGANGAPTRMFPEDIAGLHLQAYWNNATGASGDLPNFFVDPPEQLVDSDSNVSTIAFNWQTGGQWGAGTGTATPTQRMLNGLVGNEQTGPGSEGIFTFSNVPDPEPGKSHTLIVYAISPPLQFQKVRFTVNGTTEQTVYMRTMNADEYNPAPGFYRGTSTDPDNPSIGDYIRFENVVPSGGVITLTVETLTPGVDRETGVNALQLILNAEPALAAPVITEQPQPTFVREGRTARLSVTATGQGLSYQWRKNGRNLPDGGNVSGTTTANLTITSFSAADQGIYSVVVFNSGGSEISKNAAVRLSNFDITDRLVGHWKLDETGGMTAANAVAGGLPAQVNGTASWGAGQVGNAFSFDGATYLFVEDYPKAKEAISGALWVNATDVGLPVSLFRNAQGALTVSGGAQRIVGQFEIGLAQDQNDFQLRPMAAVGIGPNVARATGATPFPLGAWHHIAFSADGAQLRLYVDGAQIAVVDYLADINPPDIPYLSMGARLNVDTAFDPPLLGIDALNPNTLFGQLDEVALWTRALSATEVQLLYQAGLNGQPLSSVVVPEPGGGEPGTLRISLDGANITVTWDNGTLQTAPAVTGPWTDVQGTSPLTEPASGAAKFYRTVSQ